MCQGFRLCRLKIEDLKTEDVFSSFFISCLGSEVVIPHVMRCATVFQVRVSAHLGTLGLSPSCWVPWGVLNDATWRVTWHVRAKVKEQGNGRIETQYWVGP